MNNNLRDFLLLHLALGNWKFQKASTSNPFNYTYIYLTRTWDSKIILSVLKYKPSVSIENNVVKAYSIREYTKEVPYSNDLDESLFSTGSKLVYLRIHPDRKEVVKESFFINTESIDVLKNTNEILCNLS